MKKNILLSVLGLVILTGLAATRTPVPMFEDPPPSCFPFACEEPQPCSSC